MAIKLSTPADVMITLKQLAKSLDVAMAADLARSGNYAAAESVLSGTAKDQIEEEPVGLDLLARISVQQGHHADAEEYWKRARRAIGSDSAYEQPLHRLASIQRRNVRTLLLNPSLMSMVAILIISFMFMWLANNANNVGRMISDLSIATADQQKGMVMLHKSSQALQGRVGEEASTAHEVLSKINDQLSVMEVSLQRLNQPLGDVDEPIILVLDVPGVTTTPMTSGVTLRFDEGLFEQGVTLNDGAREQIKVVGRALEPYAAEISVSVIGHSDDLAMPAGRRYGDNISLGMARAMAVIGILRQDGGLPSAILSARSDGEFKTPFPNDSPENRMRNRTVVISVSARVAR